MLERNNPLLKETMGGISQKAKDFSVGARRYGGSGTSPHSGGGIELGGYRKRDAVARATKAMLTSRRSLKDWRS